LAGRRKIHAYGGKILRVNLSSGEIRTEATLDYAKECLGSEGIAAKILYDELRAWVTPYEPANKLIFGVGALVGTTAPAASKMNAATINTLTGGWGTSFSDTYTGGELKCAGYDSIVIEGRAPTPVWLWIRDNRVELKKADHLWGKTTWETQEALRRELGESNLHTISIGPAGEHLVRGACVVADKGRAFGRCGLGSVMGSKNLKALVAQGSGSITVANPERFEETNRRVRRMYKKATLPARLRSYGTLGIFAAKQEACSLPYKNFQELSLPNEMFEAISPYRTIEKYQVARQNFPGCPIGCGRHVHITEGPYKGLITETPQFEAIGTLQTRFGIKEPTFMYKAGALCNQLGLDNDAAGGAIGWAMECFQRGIIDEGDTDGLRLEWGNAAVVLELMQKIAYREGFGNILAEGCARAADLLGRESQYYAMHIKKQDLYEPLRGSLGWCLGTTTSTRGGGHTTGAVAVETNPGLDVVKARSVYGVNNPDKPQEYEGKAKIVTYLEKLVRACNCLGICILNTTYLDVQLMDLPQLAELYSAATGWETSVGDLEYKTRRQLNLEKAFNLRHTSFHRKDDMPTPRDMSEPIPSGRLAGWKMDERQYNRMVDEYYDLHGWDRKTSFPKRETLLSLGLEYVARDLQKIGKLR